MGNALDDAVSLERHRRSQASTVALVEQSNKTGRRAAQAAALEPLVTDFVRRMNALGNPGAEQLNVPALHGHVVSGWLVRGRNARHNERALYFGVTVDGMIRWRELRRTGRPRERITAPAHARLDFDVDLDTAKQAMAELLVRHSPSR